MLHHQQVKVSSRPGKKLTFKKLSSQMKYPEDFGDYLTISQIPQRGCLCSNQIHTSKPNIYKTNYNPNIPSWTLSLVLFSNANMLV